MLLLLAFALQPEIQELEKGEWHFGRRNNIQPSNFVVSNGHSTSNENTNEIHKHVTASLDIVGFMTIGSVCTKYNIPCAYLIEKLGLPANTTPNEKLGRLRKTYGFKMSNIEKIIQYYHTKTK